MRKARPIDLLNPTIGWVDSKVKDQRMKECLSCDKLTAVTKQCTICSCFMEMKTLLPHAECPEGKWSAVEVNNKKDKAG
jgi:hypothetical protein